MAKRLVIKYGQGSVKGVLPAVPFVSFLAAFLFIPLIALFVERLLVSDNATPEFEKVFWILRTTLLQAFLSALLSGILGTLGALLWSERPGFLARLSWMLSAVCFSLPSLVVALSFAGFWGRSGWMGTLLNRAFEFEFYGWFAVLGAHVFLNHALYLRTVGTVLKEMDRHEEMAALSLGAGRWQCFWTVTFPKLIPPLRTSFLLSFAYCLSSFLIVLLLGGGIRFTTLEIAVYEALKMQFDLPQAVWYASIQLLIALTLYLVTRVNWETGKRRGGFRPTIYLNRSFAGVALQCIFSLTYLLCVIGPICYLLVEGFQGGLEVDWFTIMGATGMSLSLGICVASLSLILSLGAAYCIRHTALYPFQKLLEFLSSAPLFISSVLLSFALMRIFSNTLRGNLLGPLGVQTMLCLPFTIRMVVGAFREVPDAVIFAARSLGANSLQRFLLIELPEIRRTVLSAFVLSMTFSMGEVSSFLIFSYEGTKTLPVLLMHWMNRYQFREASVVALLLVLLVMTVSYFIEADKKLESAPPLH